jgi:hypothetical protein
MMKSGYWLNLVGIVAITAMVALYFTAISDRVFGPNP